MALDIKPDINKLTITYDAFKEIRQHIAKTVGKDFAKHFDVLLNAKGF